MASKTHAEQHAYLTTVGSTYRYLGLLTASPTDAGTATSEVSGNGYARQSVAWGSIGDLTNGAQIANTAAVTFPSPTGAGWGTVTHVALFDALSGGTLRLWTPLSTPTAVTGGYVVSFPVGSITDLDQ